MKPWGARTSNEILVFDFAVGGSSFQTIYLFIYLFTYLFIYSRHSSQCPNGK
jgi:hypothetical protein